MFKSNRVLVYFLVAILTVVLIQTPILLPIPVVKAWGDTSTLTDAAFFDSINLDYPGLGTVKTDVNAGNYAQAKIDLLTYYKNRTNVTYPDMDSTLYFHYSAESLTDASSPDDITIRKFTFGGQAYQWPNGNVTWEQPPGEYNNEWYYSQARFYFAITAARYARDNDSQTQVNNYLDLAMEFINDKGNANAGYPRTLETGLRLENLVTAYAIIIGDAGARQYIDADRHTGLLKYLSQSADWLVLNTGVAGNWIVMENVGLEWMGIVFPEFKNAANWRSTAQDRLQYQLQNSVLPDGALNEPAITYHTGGLINHMRIDELGKLNGYDIYGTTKDKFLRMLDYTIDTADPEIKNVMIGDSSGGSVSSTLQTIGNILHRYDSVYAGTGGTSGKAPERTSSAYPYTGFYIMRSALGSSANYLTVDNQPYGGHAHPDDLNMNVNSYGKLRITDPGRYSYDNSAVPNWLRLTTEAHSTIEVDDRPQRSNGNKTDSWVTNDGFDFFNGHINAYSGYVGENKPYDFSRKVLFVKPGFWIVSDIIKNSTASSHKYEQLWQLYPNSTIPVLDGTTKSVTTQFSGEPNIQIVPADPGSITASLIDGYFSTTTLTYSDTKHASYVKNGAGDVAFDTVLYPTNTGSSASVSVTRQSIGVGQTVASSIKLDFSDGDDGYYYISHETNPTATRSFSTFQYDGELAYIQKNSSGALNSAIIKKGKLLKDGTNDLVSSSAAIDNLEVKYNGATLDVYSSKKLSQTITLYGPGVTAINYNGASKTFTSNGNYRTISATTSTVTLYPVADATIRSGSYADTNYGSSGMLEHKNDGGSNARQSLTAFQTNTIQINPGVSTLKFTTFSTHNVSATVAVYGLTNYTWSESDLTWNRAPVEIGTLLGEVAITSAPNTQYSLNVSDYVKRFKGKNVVFRFEIKETGTYVPLYSRHTGTVSYRPTLEIQNGSELSEPLYTLVNLNPIEDTYARGGTYSDTNFGSAGSLEIKENGGGDADRRSFIKFNILPYDGTINTAALKIVPTYVQTTGDTTIKLYGLTDDSWKEKNVYLWETQTYTSDGVTWNNPPSTTDEALITTFTVTQAQVGTTISLDVTNFVINHADKFISFKLVAQELFEHVNFASRNYSKMEHRPYLELK